MARKLDLIRDFPGYVKDRVRLKRQIAEFKELRDSGRIPEAGALLAKIEASALCGRVKRFEEVYGSKQ